MNSPEDQLFSQEGPLGIRFDFNEGCRLSLPYSGEWTVNIWDIDTQCLIFSQKLDGGVIQTRKKYYMNFFFEIWKKEEKVFSHKLNLREKFVLINMDKGGIGDHLAWVAHVEHFRKQHGCNITCLVRNDLEKVFKEYFPDIDFCSSLPERKDFYATYKVLIFYNDYDLEYSPIDYREVGLVVYAASILGLPLTERRPDFSCITYNSPIAERYVCIATQASSHCKFWNNPNGWLQVVEFLKKKGYRVICLDKQLFSGHGRSWHYIPYGAEDETGDRPFQERIQWLQHADFFIGLSSGLSWLAWAVGCPIIMISGFTAEKNEFSTPWRVLNRNVCNSCANDIRCQLDPTDYFWCPRHKNTEREFECSKNISVNHVLMHINSIISKTLLT